MTTENPVELVEGPKDSPSPAPLAAPREEQMARSRPKEPTLTRTPRLTLPSRLWTAACLRALHEDMPPQQLVALALTAFLKVKPEPTCEGYGPAPKGGRS